MEEPARHLLFHGTIILLLGLLVGIPYGRTILRNTDKRLIESWRVSHAALPVGAILMLVLSLSLAGLQVSLGIKWAISILFIVSGYGFAAALILGPLTGHRGLSVEGSLTAKLVYSGNLLGAVTSLAGAVVLLYAAWLNL